MYSRYLKVFTISAVIVAACVVVGVTTQGHWSRKLSGARVIHPTQPEAPSPSPSPQDVAKLCEYVKDIEVLPMKVTSLQSDTYDRYGNRSINAAQTWGTGINTKKLLLILRRIALASRLGNLAR